MAFCHSARERIWSYTSVKSVIVNSWIMRTAGLGTDMKLSVAMGTYQCLFFRDGRVGYWENVVVDGDVSIEAPLKDMRAEGEWDSAEAWRDDALVCRVTRPSGPLRSVARVSHLRNEQEAGRGRVH